MNYFYDQLTLYEYIERKPLKSGFNSFRFFFYVFLVSMYYKYISINLNILKFFKMSENIIF